MSSISYYGQDKKRQGSNIGDAVGGRHDYRTSCRSKDAGQWGSAAYYFTLFLLILLSAIGKCNYRAALRSIIDANLRGTENYCIATLLLTTISTVAKGVTE